MGFRLTRRGGSAPDTPEALFRDLRNRKVEGLLSQQADMLRTYMEHVDESDVALQMPTGSGKTLVGLLIAEWRRRKFRERSIFLCPTKQLVNQVVEQASEKYGLRTHAMTGPQRDYDANAKTEYQTAEAIAVTTYSGVFNTNPFFDNAQTIVLDDAHAAENYIADFWSLRIDRRSSDQETLYGVLLSAIMDHVSVSDFARLSRDERSPMDALWVDKLPTPAMHQLHGELFQILETHIPGDSDLSYRWSVLRDHLLACHVYLNCEGFLIRPLLPPTESHRPFAGANQRVYMSATLGEGGELERLVGKRSLTRIPAPEGWERQGVGRRLFFFPTRSLDEDDSMDLVTQMIDRTGRGLVLTPSEWQANQVREEVSDALPGVRLFSAHEIEASKRPFVETDRAVAVIANRYDGIDLVGDECRLLVAWGLPRATHLQESFLISRMGGSILYNDRILTRIVQATGRCTRSATDYAAVVIVGEELSKFLLQGDKRQYMHPELQAELAFGIEESKERSIPDFLKNLEIFLDHGEQWDEADEVIVAERDELDRQDLPCVERFVAAVPEEVSYQYAMWQGDYAGAYAACKDVLAHLSGDDLRGYRAFWNYLAGSAAWLAAAEGAGALEAQARECFSRASQASAAGLPWLHKLSRLGQPEGGASDEANAGLDAAIEHLERELEDLGTVHSGRFERRVQKILDGLGQKAANRFEEAQVLLGGLLGYTADNTTEDSGPDPWWVLDGERGIVFEDYTDCTSPDPAISTSKVRQAKGHPEWLKSKEGLADVSFAPVIVSPVERLETSAMPLAAGVHFWSVDDFRDWAGDALTVIRHLCRTFPGSGDLAWRAESKEAYVTNGLTPNAIMAKACARKLSELGGR
jgi:hypothetical protein